MSLTWTSADRSHGTLIEGVDARGWRLVAWLPVAGRDMRYLMPARVAESATGNWPADRPALVSEMEAYAARQARKLQSIDHLGLSPTLFAERFVASRLSLWVPQRVPGDEAWDFVRSGLVELERRAGRKLITQIDYDQKRVHSALSSILQIDLATMHDPSAIATTSAFLAVLRAWEVSPRRAVVTIAGIGDLGLRIVRRLGDAGVARILVFDVVPERAHGAAAAVPRVEVSRDKREMAMTPAHAHILCGDHAYRDWLPGVWAAEPSVIAVGGPEAGLDHHQAARELLGRAGKQFVPSVICGAMGLVSNLEETLGLQPDLDAMSLRFDALLKRVITHARRRGLPFDVACDQLMRGELDPAAPTSSGQVRAAS